MFIDMCIIISQRLYEGSQQTRDAARDAMHTVISYCGLCGNSLQVHSCLGALKLRVHYHCMTQL